MFKFICFTMTVCACGSTKLQSIISFGFVAGILEINKNIKQNNSKRMFLHMNLEIFGVIISFYLCQRG